MQHNLKRSVLIEISIILLWTNNEKLNREYDLWQFFYHFCSANLKQSHIYLSTHYALRVLKTTLWDSRRQTYVLKTKISKGIQKWVQNNQFQAPLSNDFFKNLFSGQKKSSKKLDDLLIFEFLQQYI